MILTVYHNLHIAILDNVVHLGKHKTQIIMEKLEIIATIRGQIKGLESFLEGMSNADVNAKRTAEVELNCLNKLLKVITDNE